MPKIPVSAEGYPSAEHIRNYAIYHVHLKDLLCSVFDLETEQFCYVSLEDSPATKLLQSGDAQAYDAYHDLIRQKHNKHALQNSESFFQLKAKLESEGYKEDKLIICRPWKNQLSISDGQNRAAILYKQNKDSKIPVLVTLDV